LKEFKKSDKPKSLYNLDWPTLTLYEVVNDIDLDESVISLISLKFFNRAMHDIYHYIYRNHELVGQTKIREFKSLTYNGNWIYTNSGICFNYRKMHNNRKKRKTLKEVCKKNNRR